MIVIELNATSLKSGTPLVVLSYVMKLLVIPLTLLTVVALAQSGQSYFSKVNSAYDEMNPVTSPDGRLLLLTIGNHPANIGGVKDPGDIWLSRWVDGVGWSAPEHGGRVINDRTFNTVAGFSADGQRIYLMNHFSGDGSSARTQGISVTSFNGNTWDKPVNISIPYFRNTSPFISGHINKEETIFVYSAETHGSRGVEDIYVSLKGNDGQWSEPRNLGPVINTSFQELSPSISDDGFTLYFSTNGKDGFGSFDVFRARRLDDTWQSWSEPENLGSAVNSQGRDLNYREYAATGISLFTTTLNSDGYGDIRMRSPDGPQPEIIASSEIVGTETTPTTNTTQISVTGRIRDALTGQQIDAELVFKSETVTSEASARAGNGFDIELSPGALYEVTIESPGYISVIQKLDLRVTSASRLEANYNLQPAVRGTRVTLESVLFEQGTTTMLSESYAELDLVVDLMSANPKIKIELAGHTENRGSEALNLRLSQDRVDVVKDYLVSRGIHKSRIRGKGYGSSQPIAGNETEESRRLNRRVEFMIRKN